jgi:hypothetical protein
MNYRFHKYSDNQKLTNYWDLVIIDNNGKTLYYTVYYNYELNYYYVRGRKNRPEITEYLISNNICTIYKTYSDTSVSLMLNPHILLELI